MKVARAVTQGRRNGPRRCGFYQRRRARFLHVFLFHLQNGIEGDVGFPESIECLYTLCEAFIQHPDYGAHELRYCLAQRKLGSWQIHRRVVSVRRIRVVLCSVLVDGRTRLGFVQSLRCYKSVSYRQA